jgi:hypothetical protein
MLPPPPVLAPPDGTPDGTADALALDVTSGAGGDVVAGAGADGTGGAGLDGPGLVGDAGGVQVHVGVGAGVGG